MRVHACVLELGEGWGGSGGRVEEGGVTSVGGGGVGVGSVRYSLTWSPSHVALSNPTHSTRQKQWIKPWISEKVCLKVSSCKNVCVLALSRLLACCGSTCCI